MKKILVTGGAGFIGRAVCERLLVDKKYRVIAIDNLNSYYSLELKLARLETLSLYPQFSFEKIDIADHASLFKCFESHQFDTVIHLAAQAGVRYSIENPMAYTQSNLVGTANILEACRIFNVSHLVMASSSSVYGRCTDVPFHEEMNTDSPVSYYAATKKANEVMAYSYSTLYQLPITALRFFTVYGPWGRPDMAPWLFTQAILENKPIRLFNHGQLWRDYTYIDDIVTGIIETTNNIPLAQHSQPPYILFNIGNHQPVLLEEFVNTLERILERPAQKILLPMQNGDVYTTCAHTERLRSVTGFAPSTSLVDGLTKFVAWYRSYFKI